MFNLKTKAGDTVKLYLKFFIFLLLIGTFSITGPSAQSHLTGGQMNNSTPPHLTTQLSPDDPQVKAEFDRIAAVPYDEKNHNCLNKSIDLRNYLVERGAPHTHILFIEHESGEYMHAFVLWDGLVYDPTKTPPTYGEDYNRYVEELEKLGFINVTEYC